MCGQKLPFVFLEVHFQNMLYRSCRVLARQLISSGIGTPDFRHTVVPALPQMKGQ